MENKLSFGKSGKFRILMVSDIQDTLDYRPETPVVYGELIDRVRPDLIIWGGDNIDGRKCKTAEELKAYLDVFTAPAEKKRIPWMYIFGNHDYDMDITPSQQAEIYKTYPHCITDDSSAAVHGVSNTSVTIYGPDGRPAFAVYGFDTGHKFPELRKGVPAESLMLDERPKFIRKWDCIRFDQIMWYWNRSVELENEAGRTVPALAAMHVPPYEMEHLRHNPEACSVSGEYTKGFEMSVLNSGVFAAMLERGDVKAICAGHLHESTVDGIFGGIHICLDGCAGLAPKSLDCCRGGRVFDVDTDGNITTEFIAYNSFTSI